jgi:GGDEF domain-containing protein
MDEARYPGYDILAELRGLERRVEAVEASWRLFDDSPAPGRLQALREDLVEAVQLIDRMEMQLGSAVRDGPLASGAPPGQAVPGTSPPARSVIDASRALDRLLWQVNAGWQELRARPREESLAALSDLLRAARGRAATLRQALETASMELTRRRMAGPEDARGPAGSPVGAPEAEIDAESARDQVSQHGQEIESLLWRIHSDWQHLRRGPAADRVGVLEDELDSTAARVGDLQRVVRRAPDGSLTAAFGDKSAGRAAAHFPPYRDGFTGAYNREGFDSLAGAELKRCRRYGRPFGLLVVEVRPVELYRLRDEVALVEEQLRAYDLLARYVDRLLVAGLPESGAGDTRRVAIRILSAFRRAGLETDLVRLSYAALPEDGYTLSELMEAARQRLDAGTDDSPPV